MPDKKQAPPKGPQNAPILIQKITIRPVERSSQDIDSWRNALKYAESDMGNRVRLYDLYEDVLLDGHLSTVLEKRVNAVKNADLVFVGKDGKPVEEMTKLIELSAFELLLEEIMNAKFWGKSLIEISPDPIMFTSLPRKHIRPKQGLLVWEQLGYDGIYYREPPYNRYLLEVGNDTNLGLILKACQYVIYKRGNFGDWAQFAEIFGMPFRVGRYDGYDDKTRIELEQALERAGSAAHAVIPKEGSIEFLENKSTGSADLYSGLNTACNNEISKLILGQTETTESSDSSGYAQAKEHGETEDDINKADRRYVTRLLNEKVIPLLELHGWPVAGGRFQFPKTSKPLSVEEIVSLSDLLPIGTRYAYDSLGIPKPEEGEDILQPRPKAAEPVAEPKPPGDPEPEKKPKPEVKPKKEPEEDKGKKPKSGWRLFFEEARLVLGLGGQAEIMKYRVDSLYNRTCQQCGGQISLVDKTDTITLAMNFQEITDDFVREVYEGRGGQISEELYQATATALTNGMLSALGAKTFSYDDPNNALAAYLEHNIGVFSAAKCMTERKIMTALINDGTGNPKPFNQFRKDVEQINKLYNEDYLRAEYNHVVAASQMAGKWTQFEDAGGNLKYSTAGDNRVRPEHKALDGIIMPVSSSFWDRAYPPNDWNCRCTVVPTTDKPNRTEPESRIAAKTAVKKPLFNANVGKQRVIFQDGHPYMKVLDKTRQLSAEKDYGLPSYDQLRLRYDLPTVTKMNDEAEYRAWWQEMVDKNGVNETDFAMKDRSGLSILFRGNKEFGEKIINRGRQDYGYLSTDVLTDPDEVWTHKYEGGTLASAYIKYFDDAPYILIVEVLKNGTLAAQTFFKNDMSKEAELNKRRTGVLKYKRPRVS